jgi:4'-phosphopantetheinyl transferase
MVRHLCGIYLGVAPAEVRLDKTPAGKPCLAHPIPAGRQRFEFNVAHSGDWVLVAWAEGFALGVDVEALDPNASRTLAGEVSASVFSPDERAVLSAANPEEVPGTFYRIWVRIEAVLKGEVGKSLT